jgi:phenylpropionate dioxygenase-like ring-hydroxylating dioxygenase large terminal subunit
MLPEQQMIWPRNMNEVPKAMYTNKALFEVELKRIFYGAEWHPIAHESEVAKIGDFKTVRLARVPLLVARGNDGVVRVFFNSCPHRGNEVESTRSGNRKRFECPYHRWQFRNDGTLIGCPAQQEYSPGFDKADFGLRQPRTETFFGLVFVTFSDETVSLEAYLGDLKPTLAKALGGDGRLVPIGSQRVRYATNWKIYGDNDAFHGPLLHKALNMLSWQANNGFMRTCTDRGHVAIETDLVSPPDDGTLKDPSIVRSLNKAGASSAAAIFFPTFVATKHLDVLNLRFMTPLGPDEVEVNYAYFAHQDDDEEMFRQRVRQGSNLLGPTGFISMEDAAIFHRSLIGCETPGSVIFQKGVKDASALDTNYRFNDETHALVHWEHYRKVMGFERSAT